MRMASKLLEGALQVFQKDPKVKNRSQLGFWVGQSQYSVKGGAPRREERGRLGLGGALGRGKATMRAPRVEETNPLPKNGTWGQVQAQGACNHQWGRTTEEDVRVQKVRVSQGRVQRLGFWSFRVLVSQGSAPHMCEKLLQFSKD